MKKILLAISMLAVLSAFGQQWAEYKVDSNLTVTIPDNYGIIDTLGQHIVKAQITNAIIMIQRLANTGETATRIQSKEELTKNYEEFQKGVVNSQQGKLRGQQMFEESGLQLTQFTFAASMGGEKQLRHFVIAFINENWYAISFWEVEAMTDELKSDREKLFASLKFPAGASLKNQLSNVMERSASYKAGYFVGKLLFYGLLIGAALALIRWSSKKRKQKRPQDAG